MRLRKLHRTSPSLFLKQLPSIPQTARFDSPSHPRAVFPRIARNKQHKQKHKHKQKQKHNRKRHEDADANANSVTQRHNQHASGSKPSVSASRLDLRTIARAELDHQPEGQGQCEGKVKVKVTVRRVLLVLLPLMSLPVCLWITQQYDPFILRDHQIVFYQGAVGGRGEPVQNDTC